MIAQVHQKRNKSDKGRKKKFTCKILENESNVTFIIFVRLFSGKKRLIKNIFLTIVIFLDIKYIKTRPYSNKILSQNVKPFSGIKLEIIG